MSTVNPTPPRRLRALRHSPRLPAVVLAVGVLAMVLLKIPGSFRDFIDLEVYRDAALAALRGESVYDSGHGRMGLPFTYPPFALVVFFPLALMSFGVGVYFWFALSVIALVDACVSLQRWGAAEGWRPVPPLLLAGLAFTFEPVTGTFGYGQVNLLLFALLLRDATGRTPLPQGVLTGLCAGFKLTPAAFGLYYLVTGRWSALRNATLAGVASIAVSAAIVPDAAKTFWWEATFADSSRPGALWFLTNQSLAGALTRWLPTDTGALVANVLALPVVVLAGWVAYRAHREGRDLLAFAAVAAVPLLISPISWSHHWVTALMWPMALVLGPWRLSRRVRLSLASILVFVYASRAMWVLPRGDDVELRFSVAGDLLATTYTLGALAFLGALWVEFATGSVPAAPDTEGSTAVDLPHASDDPSAAGQPVPSGESGGERLSSSPGADAPPQSPSASGSSASGNSS